MSKFFIRLFQITIFALFIFMIIFSSGIESVFGIDRQIVATVLMVVYLTIIAVWLIMSIKKENRGRVLVKNEGFAYDSGNNFSAISMRNEEIKQLRSYLLDRRKEISTDSVYYTGINNFIEYSKDIVSYATNSDFG